MPLLGDGVKRIAKTSEQELWALNVSLWFYHLCLFSRDAVRKDSKMAGLKQQ